MLQLVALALLVPLAWSYSLCPLHVECIPGCVKLDERGCKMCACGPQMFHFGAGYYGMPGAGALGGSSFVPGTLGGGGAFGGMQGGHHASSSGGSSGGYHAVQEKPLKECHGTMLCMMSCKSEATLSSHVGSNGCRSCTCSHSQAPAPQPVVLVQQPKPVTHNECTGTKLCMMTCKTKYVLGEKGRDGCQTCACLPEAQPPAVVLKPEPERHECLAVTHCIVSCHHGYSLSGQGECQKCTCNPAPTQPPARHQECTATLNCMLSCKHGYQLGSAGHDGCPECLCLQPQPQKVEVIPVKLVTCSSALTCSAGCTVGYKCGEDGCPTCECIHPQVVGILHVTEVHTSKQVSCTTAFSCPDKCTLGYKCGDDGCPTCECLIAVHTEAKPAPKPQATLNIVQKCPATLNCMSTCHTGYTLGTDGADGCPICTCIETEPCHEGCESSSTAIAVHTCSGTTHCMAKCTNGYTMGAAGHDGCPACQCKDECNECEKTEPVIIPMVQTSGCETGTCEHKCDGDCGQPVEVQVVQTSGCETGTCEHKCEGDCNQPAVIPVVQTSGCETGTCEHKCEGDCGQPVEVQLVQTSGCETGTCEHKCDGDCNHSGGEVALVSSGGSSSGSSGGSGGGAAGGAMGGGMAGGGGAGGAMAGGGSAGATAGGGDHCEPIAPNCHPWCIKYDVAHCRKCECQGM